jgi:hypothetical protein
MTTPTVECLDPEQVQVGTPNGPGIYIAPPNTPAPPNTTGDWPSPWKCLGYLSDDGPTVGQSTDSEDLTPWQSVAPIKSIITARSVTMQFVLWQLNPDTLALYFDTDVPTAGTDGSLDMDVRTDQAGHTYAIGIDSRDGNRVLRITFPRASLSDAGDMAITRGAVVPLDCTLSALETAGVLAHISLGPAITGVAMSASANGTGANHVDQPGSATNPASRGKAA